MESRELRFESRRTPLCCLHGVTASSQPLASQIGLDILKKGGNAADAAVAMAAALNVTMPTSTGIGGDAFCLFYDADSKSVKAVNGSGRAPSGLSLEKALADGFSECFPQQHGHAVTVPGTAATWVDTVDRFGSGKLTLTDLLGPAIQLTEEGHPVCQNTAYSLEKSKHLLLNPGNEGGKDWLIDGRAPRWGEVLKLPNLAKTFRTVAAEGKRGFYEGRIAQAIVDIVQKFGGVMSLEDLKNHETTFPDAISVDYKGKRVWEIPPNGQGIVALMALNILEDFNLSDLGHNSVEYLHKVIEALHLAFADAQWYVADADKVQVPIDGMISKQYAKERRSLMNPDKALQGVDRGHPENNSSTVYFTVADDCGNACSFIQSNYMGLGSGLVPLGCGFTLQNRGCNFSLKKGHPNVVAPNKRPYHTIIPAMVTSPTGELLASYGVMGGFMQPQGHVQVLLNMLEFGMNPQEALDKPRFCIGPGHTGCSGSIFFEDGIPNDILEKLRALGHKCEGPVQGPERLLFGRGHVITKGAWFLKSARKDAISDKNVWWAGTDPRGDGSTCGY